MYLVTPRSQAEVNQIVSFLHSNPHWKDLGAPHDELFRVGQTAIFWNVPDRLYTPMAYKETLEQVKDYEHGVTHIKVNELHKL